MTDKIFFKWMQFNLLFIHALKCRKFKKIWENSFCTLHGGQSVTEQQPCRCFGIFRDLLQDRYLATQAGMNLWKGSVSPSCPVIIEVSVMRDKWSEWTIYLLWRGSKKFQFPLAESDYDWLFNTGISWIKNFKFGVLMFKYMANMFCIQLKPLQGFNILVLSLNKGLHASFASSPHYSCPRWTSRTCALVDLNSFCSVSPQEFFNFALFFPQTTECLTSVSL